VKKTLDQPHSTKPLPAFSEDGVDLTLIRWMLSLTVEERLQLLEDYAAFAWELRHANPRGLAGDFGTNPPPE